MSDSAIVINNAGKKFSKSLRAMMWYGASDMFGGSLGFLPQADKLRPGEFWALDDVSLELKRGESLGIIGPNGSGKTTLLRLLNGIFLPDKGRIEVNGRVGGLIHVGAGFHPMLTGRENIYVNGSILGMAKKEIDRKFDAIVDFADIGDFLDAPVKQYSSGMYVRLGFAVAIHSAPDILLIDEVLAVGDRDFSMKCYTKMKEIREQGATIILVSHNEYVIRERTQRAVYLRNGRQRFLGSSEEAVSFYIKDSLEAKAAAMKRVEAGTEKAVARKAEILEVQFLDRDGRPVSALESGEAFSANIRFRVNVPIEKPVFSVNFYTDNGLVYAANSSYEGVSFKALQGGEGSVKVRIPRLDLPTDTYYVSVLIGEGDAGDPVDFRHFAYTFVVSRAKNARGLLKLPVEWALEA